MITTPNGRSIQPYLFFDGRCEEGLEFYARTVGAQVETLMRFKESPDPHGMCSPDSGEKVRHASCKIGESRLMASDGRCTGQPNSQAFGLPLAASSEKEAD